jgi:hypothetical protein
MVEGKRAVLEGKRPVLEVASPGRTSVEGETKRPP